LGNLSGWFGVDLYRGPSSECTLPTASVVGSTDSRVDGDASFLTVGSDEAVEDVASQLGEGGFRGGAISSCVGSTIGQVPVCNLRVIVVCVEQGLRPIRLSRFAFDDRAGERQDTARDSEGYRVCGQIAGERVEPYRGRSACDR